MLERLKRPLGRVPQSDDLSDRESEYLEGADEEGGVGGLLGRGTREVVDLVALIFGMGEQLLELGHVLPGLAQVQRPEILVEAVVDQVLGRLWGTLSILK